MRSQKLWPDEGSACKRCRQWSTGWMMTIDNIMGIDDLFATRQLNRKVITNHIASVVRAFEAFGMWRERKRISTESIHKLYCVLYRFQLREAIQFKFVFVDQKVQMISNCRRQFLSFYLFSCTNWFNNWKMVTFVRLLLVCATFLSTFRLILFVFGDPLFIYVLQCMILLSFRRTQPRNYGRSNVHCRRRRNIIKSYSFRLEIYMRQRRDLWCCRIFS